MYIVKIRWVILGVIIQALGSVTALKIAFHFFDISSSLQVRVVSAVSTASVLLFGACGFILLGNRMSPKNNIERRVLIISQCLYFFVLTSFAAGLALNARDIGWVISDSYKGLLFPSFLLSFMWLRGRTMQEKKIAKYIFNTILLTSLVAAVFRVYVISMEGFYGKIFNFKVEPFLLSALIIFSVTTKSGWKRLLFIGLATLFAILTVVSLKRAAMLGVIITILLALYVSWKYSKKYTSFYLYIFLLSVIPVIYFTGTGPLSERVVGRVMFTFRNVEHISLNAIYRLDGSTYGRISEAIGVVYTLSEKGFISFLTGLFPGAIITEHPSFPITNAEGVTERLDFHNIHPFYFSYVIKFGLIGLAMFGYIIYSTAYPAIKIGLNIGKTTLLQKEVGVYLMASLIHVIIKMFLSLSGKTFLISNTDCIVVVVLIFSATYFCRNIGSR